MDDRDTDNNEVRRGADLKLTFTPSKLISKLDIFEDKNIFGLSIFLII